MELTALAVGEPNGGAVLRAARAAAAFEPGGGAPGDVDDVVTLTLLSQTTHDVPGCRGDAGSCGRVGDGHRWRCKSWLTAETCKDVARYRFSHPP